MVVRLGPDCNCSSFIAPVLKPERRGGWRVVKLLDWSQVVVFIIAEKYLKLTYK